MAFISIGEYGGRTRSRLSVEINRRDKREKRYENVDEALAAIQKWLLRELESQTRKEQ